MIEVWSGEVQAARAFLRSYADASSHDIPPRQFAMAAKELNVGYRELFRLVSQLYAGNGQLNQFDLQGPRS